MDISTIAELIASVGFPITACCVMFVQNNKLQDTLKDICVTMQKMADEIEDMGVKKHDT